MSIHLPLALTFMYSFLEPHFFSLFSKYTLAQFEEKAISKKLNKLMPNAHQI